MRIMISITNSIVLAGCYHLYDYYWLAVCWSSLSLSLTMSWFCIVSHISHYLLVLYYFSLWFSHDFSLFLGSMSERVYIYIYIHTCMCVYVYMRMYVCIYIYIYIWERCFVMSATVSGAQSAWLPCDIYIYIHI